MRIFSGIQPTGEKHFGNYSGGFRQYAATQEEGDAFFCIVDLHSITVEHDPRELHDSTLDLAAILFATGLDPDRSTVFVQSHVTAHRETFKVPTARFPETGGRIMDLQEPDRKMSTTDSQPAGKVLLTDPPDTIRKKLKSAVTDSGTDVHYDPEQKPGISNLLEIMSVATGDPIPDLETRYDSGGYGQFKSDVAEAVVTLLDPIRARYEELRADEPELRGMLARGADKARAASAP